MKKIIFVLFGVVFLAGCSEQEAVVQQTPAVAAVAPAETDPVVHNEQITIPDKPMPKMTGKNKF